MTLKAVLLGSAAAVAVVGGARAADLAIAAPIDYVRVCDAMGTGYWYIPGTDTCLKIGGEVNFSANFHDQEVVLGGDEGVSDHEAVWDFETEAQVDLTAKSLTQYGVLTGYISMDAVSSNAQEGPFETDGDGLAYIDVDRTFYVDEAYVELGPFMAGYTGSTYDYADSFTEDTTERSDATTDQIRLTWAMAGFGFMLAVEDPRDRWGTALPETIQVPDLVAAVSARQAGWDGKLSAGYAQLDGGDVWGVNGGVTFNLDPISSGDRLRLNAAVGTGSSFIGEGATDFSTNWSAFASLKHFWSPTLSSNVTGGYLGNGGGADAWSAAANLVWEPVSGFSVDTRVIYTQPVGDSAEWSGRIQVNRAIGD